MSSRNFWMAMVAAAALACRGVKFAPDSLNGQAWPDELAQRQYFKSAGVYYRNLSGLVGHVLFPRKVNGQCPTTYTDADLSLEQYVLAGSKLEPDTTAVERYSDRIDNRATVDASVLTVATKLAANQAAEVVVADTTALIVPDAAIDLAKLQILAGQPMQPDDCDRIYIRGVTVTTVTYRTATEVDGSATVSGSAFGANSKVYNSARKYSLDYRLGVTVLPVRPGMRLVPPGLAPRDPNRPLEGISVPRAGFRLR